MNLCLGLIEGKIDVNNKLKAFKKKSKWSFTKVEIVEMYSFLMDNIFVKFGGKIFKQVIGIPTGCDCAPKVAD